MKCNQKEFYDDFGDHFCVSQAQMPAEELQKEIDTLKSLDHPHIIKLL